MSIFSEVATESTISSIVRELKKKYTDETNPERKDGFRQSILICLNHFEWNTPSWAERIKHELRD